mmetsp:Transcript_20739/g.59052  ORF Transcript_20739/g.59052 Transcript_20739/m.59052 type:complete len:284 (+) Transcript_20739:441-1292(+)
MPRSRSVKVSIRGCSARVMAMTSLATSPAPHNSNRGPAKSSSTCEKQSAAWCLLSAAAKGASAAAAARTQRSRPSGSRASSSSSSTGCPTRRCPSQMSLARSTSSAAWASQAAVLDCSARSSPFCAAEPDSSSLDAAPSLSNKMPLLALMSSDASHSSSAIQRRSRLRFVTLSSAGEPPSELEGDEERGVRDSAPGGGKRQSGAGVTNVGTSSSLSASLSVEQRPLWLHFSAMVSSSSSGAPLAALVRALTHSGTLLATSSLSAPARGAARKYAVAARAGPRK